MDASPPAPTGRRARRSRRPGTRSQRGVPQLSRRRGGGQAAAAPSFAASTLAVSCYAMRRWAPEDRATTASTSPNRDSGV